MAPSDTSAKAAALQVEIHRRFSPSERLQMAIEMSEFARKLTKAGLRSRHPEYSDAELELELLHQLYGYRPRGT
jgi:hypothetical protein